MTIIAEKTLEREPQDDTQAQGTQGVQPDHKASYDASSVEGYKTTPDTESKPKGLMKLVEAYRARQGLVPQPEVSPEPAPKPKPKRIDPGAAPIVTKRWRDLPPESLLSFYAQAIRDLGDPVLFSLHFTLPIHENMKLSKNSRDYIAKRMRRHLPKVPFYFVVELTRRSRFIHIHGALARSKQTEGDIRGALQKVCGDKRKAHTKMEVFFINCKARHTMLPDWSLNFRKCFADFGWAQYCGKDMQKTVRRLNLSGTMLSRTHTVHMKAREGHKIDCDI